MRILHVSKYYYPSIGGVENICKYLVENMPQHQIGVVCFNENSQCIDEEVNGHKVWRVGTQLNIARQALSAKYLKVLKRAIREFKPDLVQLHWANPFPAAMLLMELPKEVKLVVHWHMDIIAQKFIYPLIKPIETAMLRRADAVCVTSPIYADKSLPLQPFADKISIVPNACDNNFLTPQPNDEALIAKIRQRYDNKPIVFFVGRHIQYKGLIHLINAVPHIKGDCEVLIAGKGPLTDELQARSRHMPKVHFIGSLSDTELRCHLKASRVFAFPSVTKNEAFGVALAEAMYVGLPAVTFHIPGSGVNWVSPNGLTSLEVENSNEREFARAIDRLLSDDALHARLSRNSAKRASEMFTIDCMCNAMQQVYDQL